LPENGLLGGVHILCLIHPRDASNKLPLGVIIAIEVQNNPGQSNLPLQIIGIRERKHKHLQRDANFLFSKKITQKIGILAIVQKLLP
jgi:hypothetical protein